MQNFRRESSKLQPVVALVSESIITRCENVFAIMEQKNCAPFPGPGSRVKVKFGSGKITRRAKLYDPKVSSLGEVSNWFLISSLGKCLKILRHLLLRKLNCLRSLMHMPTIWAKFPANNKINPKVPARLAASRVLTPLRSGVCVLCKVDYANMSLCRGQS